MNRINLPSGREAVYLVICLAIWLGVTGVCLSLRVEHWFLAVLIAGLFLLNGTTRKLVVALIPFAVFGISYDWMGLVHNYEVNPVDIRGLYETEKALFGIPGDDGAMLTPNEYFALHNNTFLDFITGLFYLCWVPVPMAFGVYLFCRKKRGPYLHFALVFLLVNFIGFTIYYIHPTAPPWYVENYGFDFAPDAAGNVAGLGRFDDLLGVEIFHNIYTRNSNIYAAMPSLHSAYVPTALFYAFRSKSPVWMRVALAVIACGIWFTAVYSFHHYLLDVIAGVMCTVAGVALFEGLLMRIPAFKRFMNAYTAYIS